jgi:hypothetical protein
MCYVVSIQTIENKLMCAMSFVSGEFRKYEYSCISSLCIGKFEIYVRTSNAL